MSAFPAPGSCLGPYRVVRELGRGGMGIVLEVLDEALARRVALKVISSELAAEPGFRARFTREARAQASLDSPHAVTVYAHGEVDGRLYIATQLVPGGDLGAWLREHGPPPPGVAVELVAHVADGLAAAHADGLVHGDIKPANVLLKHGEDGVTAYLADFGIAHRTGAACRPSAAGAVPGTPGYLAPELLAGGAPTPASDVYAMGCLLWATLAGRPPTPRPSAPVPRLAAEGRWGGRLDRVLRTALAKDAADRYRSAAELRDDLRGVLRRTGPRVPRRLIGGALGVVGAVAVVGGLLITASGPRPSAPGPAGAHDPADARVARAITEALAASRAVRRTDAACVARALVRRSGVDGLVSAGLLDARHHVVATTSSDLDDAVLRAVVGAGLSCILDAPRRGVR